MQRTFIDKIEYLILLVSEFASRSNLSEVQAYRYLSQYGALALCEKHYNIMHTLSVEDNMQTLQSYCRRKGGTLLFDSITALLSASTVRFLYTACH